MADVAGYSPLMGAGEEGTFTTKIKEHRGRFVYTGSAGPSIAVPLASRWRHHNTATPATTTNGTTAICTMIQPAPSSMHAWQFARALAVSERHGWTRFVSMQNLVNLLYREEEREMLPLCAAEGIGVIPWSPQARGRLTRDWDYTSIRTETDDTHQRLFGRSVEADRKVVDRVAEVAKARGIPRAQVALAWLLAKPVITAPIVGATKLHHLDDALASVNVTLSADEITSLEAPYVPHAVVGFV